MSDQKANFHRLEAFPRLRLANSPTPIEPCPLLSETLECGCRIFIKRDDYIGYLVGGNKVRKLEYVMAEAVRKKATAVVTVGSVQSNHARVTAMAARRLGLKCELVLNGEPPDPPCANFLINQSLGIPVHIVATREDRVPKMDDVAARLEKDGENVVRISLGASDSVGALGFVAGFVEMIDQEAETGVRFDKIVISSSSGGTQAGLEAGKRLLNRPDMEIVGVSPDDPSQSIRRTVMEIGRPLLDKFESSADMREADIVVEEGFIGGGYGVSTPESREAAEMFNRREGILLDPVYTAKAAAALISLCRTARFESGKNILFWHTGGLISLFR